MLNHELSLKNQFFIDKFNKHKMMAYEYLRYNQKHKEYELGHRMQTYKLGIQICDFINTDFNNISMAREFVDKYNITTIAHLLGIKVYEYCSIQEYNELVDDVLNKLKDKLEEYRKAFINDITYIYNLNELEELSDLTPIQRLHILRSCKKGSEIQKIFDPNNLKLTLKTILIHMHLKLMI